MKTNRNQSLGTMTREELENNIRELREEIILYRKRINDIQKIAQSIHGPLWKKIQL